MGKRFLLLTTIVALVVSCGGETTQQFAGAAAPVRVGTLRVAREPLTVAITAVGTIEPENQITVAAQEDGLVTALLAREGDQVERGEVLVELDDRELSAQLAEAQARLVEAEAQWGRAESLRRDGLVTEAEADSARASLDVAKARVDALRTRVSFTRIVAPQDGVVTVRHVELGDVVGARSPVLELASGRLVLRVPVSELEVVRLEVGDRAKVTVDALPETPVLASILRIFPAADKASRQVTVELVLDDPPDELRPGFLARADLVVRRLEDALMIPEPAIQRGSEINTFVWVIENGAARARPIQVGVRQGGRAQVEAGLQEGDEVVVEGAALLRDGEAVLRAGDES